MGPIIPTLLLSLAGASLVNAYWLMGISMSQFRSGACKEVLTRTNPSTDNFIATERMDPIVDAGEISAHAHSSETWK